MVTWFDNPVVLASWSLYTVSHEYEGAGLVKLISPSIIALWEKI